MRRTSREALEAANNLQTDASLLLLIAQCEEQKEPPVVWNTNM